MVVKAAAAVIGVVFGLMICMSGMTSPAIIREALLFQDAYLYFFMMSAMGTATLGLWLLRRGERRAVLTGERIAWSVERPERRHIVGAMIFGAGWGLTNVCPGPVATQLGQGIGWSLLTAAGVLGGVWLFLRRGARETEPAREEPAPDAAPQPA